jgi:aryl-alcohol dehydrogenase-like predicted oxidoreductase
MALSTPQQLPTRKIGNDTVSAIGYGGMGLSAFYGPTLPDEERFKLLDTVYERGVTLWDTADIYGDSEDLIGKWYAHGHNCVTFRQFVEGSYLQVQA